MRLLIIVSFVFVFFVGFIFGATTKLYKHQCQDEGLLTRTNIIINSGIIYKETTRVKTVMTKCQECHFYKEWKI